MQTTSQAVPAEVLSWLTANAATSDFAGSLQSQWLRKGSLSEKQIAAVQNSIVKNAARANRLANAQTVDVREIEARFEYAKAKQIKTPMLRLSVYKFKAASMNGNNAGAIWVVHTQQQDQYGKDLYLGKIKDGKFLPSNACTPDMEDDIIKVAANPAEAARAYGQRTGNCCVCGRLLTKDESINKMIGPICAERYGF